MGLLTRSLVNQMINEPMQLTWRRLPWPGVMLGHESDHQLGNQVTAPCLGSSWALETHFLLMTAHKCPSPERR